MDQSQCGTGVVSGSSSSISTSVNTFSFHLYRELVKKNAGKNIFFSPYSISSAMLMLYLGCRDESKSEVAKALVVEGFEKVHFASKELRQSLLQPTEGIELHTANRLFPEVTYQIKEEFLAEVKEYYDSEVSKLDFKGNSEVSRKAVNDWVSERTHRKIQDLMPAGSISSDTRLVLSNAVYFKGNWETKFEKANTAERDFYVSQESIVKVHLMTKKAKYNIAMDMKTNIQMLELPYKNNTTSMIIVLPKDRYGLTEMEKNLDVSKLIKMEKSFAKEEILLGLPKMKLEFEDNLMDSFKALGATSIFNQDANLTGISETRDLVVSAIAHKAFIEVNEEGTEAAAATGIAMSRMALMPPMEFICDHPFLFFIKHKPSNTILFAGRLINPQEITE